MGIIQKLFVNHQKKIKARNDLCDSLITQVDTALREVDMLLSDVRAFVEPSEEDVWKKRNALVIANVNYTNIQRFRKAVHYKELLDRQSELYHTVGFLKQQISTHNTTM